MTKPKLYRQGDVLFIASAQKRATGTKRENGTVAYGEATGHSHRLADLASADVLVGPNGELAVSVHENGATFIHEEHGPIVLPPGDYEVRIQREYSPEAIRNVID